MTPVRAYVRLPSGPATAALPIIEALLVAYAEVQRNVAAWVEVRSDTGLRVAYWLRDSSGRLRKRGERDAA